MKLKITLIFISTYTFLSSCTAVGAVIGSNNDTGGFTLKEPYSDLKVDDKLEITLVNDSTSLYQLEMNDNINKILYVKEYSTQLSKKFDYNKVKSLYQPRNGNGFVTGLAIGAVIDLFILSNIIKNIKIGNILKF